MTNQEMLEVALTQSAIDCNCETNDFLKEENVIVLSQKNEQARKYLELPFFCQLVSYGNNIVASVQEDCKVVVENYINHYDIAHCFETPNLHVLNEALLPYGQKICFMAEYFLPDVDRLEEKACAYECRIMEQKDFADLYVPEWNNALCEHRKHLDVLGVGAYCEGKLIALAGCSADCDRMWQIGVDVLPQYRRQGLATALTSKLALEILKRGKVPFYCAAWCNLKSVRNAIKCGFKPAWVEMTAKPVAVVDKMNLTNVKK